MPRENNGEIFEEQNFPAGNVLFAVYQRSAEFIALFLKLCGQSTSREHQFAKLRRSLTQLAMQLPEAV